MASSEHSVADMASSEHSVAAQGAAVQSAEKPHHPLVLYNFQRLPSDLQARIVTMSCWLPASSTFTPENFHPVSHLDANTALSMALVCKDFHRVAVKALYERIHVGKPSTLRMLVDSTISRPVLGRLIKSLHIGPDDPLPSDWYPIIDGKRLRIQPTAPWHGKSAPWWTSVTGHHSISIDRSQNRKGPTAACRALEAAVDVASRSLDVDLLRCSYTRSGSYMKTQLWYCGVFEVYAAAELYLMEMSGWETKKQPGWYDDDRFYPSLIMTEGQLQPSQLHPAGKGGDSAGCFHLTRSQLLERLAAPNIRTDRFNHPLLFARSDTAWEAP